MTLSKTGRSLMLWAQRQDLPAPRALRALGQQLMTAGDTRGDTQAVDDWTAPLAGAGAGGQRPGPPLPIAELDARPGHAARAAASPASMRCLIATCALDAGGIPEVVAFLARRLPAHGIDVTVLHITDEGNERTESARVAAALRREGVEVVAADRAQGPATLSTHRVDVISAHDPPDWLLEAAAALRVPVVETLHGVPTPIGTAWDHESVRSLGVRSFTAVSDVVRRQYVGGNPWIRPADIVTIPNALDDARLTVLDRERARAWLGLEDEFLFLSVGRHCPQKNAYGLLTAFADVARSHPDAHLLVTGRVDDLTYARQVQQLRDRQLPRSRVHLRDHCATLRRCSRPPMRS
jgi:glycosyltransferase involved in cell wall biosynthesis